MTTEERLVEFARLVGKLVGEGEEVPPDVYESARLLRQSIRQDAATITRLESSFNSAVRGYRYTKRELGDLEARVEVGMC